MPTMKILLFLLIVWNGHPGGDDGVKLVAAFLAQSPSSVPFLSRRVVEQPRECRFADSDSVIQRLSPAKSFRREISVLASVSDNSTEEKFVEAEDLEALQALFSKYCDKEGLMTKKAVMKIPAIVDLMADGDLLPEEFNDLWDKAPKFPDAVEKEGTERIDVDSFVQVYRDIDDLFEDDEDGEEDDNTAKGATTAEQSAPSTTGDDSDKQVLGDDDDADSDEADDTLDEELESIYELLCDKAGLISKTELRNWDEISKLVEDGLLGEDEFGELWEKTKKSPASVAEERLDVEGFLSFNVGLDDLFAFEDDEMDDVIVPKSAYTIEEVESTPPPAGNVDSPAVRMVEGGDLPPDILFISLANEDGLVGLDELKRWSELQQMLEEGDLLPSELDDVFKSVKKSEMDLNKVEEEGFVALYEAIDNLFEADDDEDGSNTSEPPQINRIEELLDAIADLESEDLLPCGLEASDREKREILSIVEMVENQPTNIIRAKQGAIEPKELGGTWDLLYSSSSAMKFNKGLSGIGGSLPNGKFGSLQQKLVITKFLTDVEYIERINVTPSSASFDVTVTGTWDLRTSVSLFTGEPSIVMTVAPDRVTYGPTSTRGDHWKSLGPLNMLDISYLDEDIRIMRGNTSIETVFVFRRTSE